MAAVPLCTLLHLCIAISPPDSLSPFPMNERLGVNYGRVADNLPAPVQAVAMMKKMGVGMVKLFDANQQVLVALGNTGIKVSIMVTNEDIAAVAQSQEGAEQWVQMNVIPYYPSTLITFLVVGNEILSYPALAQTWIQLLPAMEFLHASLLKHNIKNIKVTTSVAADVLATSYPPSNGSFRNDVKDTVIKPILKFLSSTNSIFFINLYPYFAWAADTSGNISLSYALFGPDSTHVKDGKLEYSNILDAMVDATYTAMERLGYGDVALGISETGWPSGGDSDERGATVENAALYNRRLVRKVMADPPLGTPKRPRSVVPTFIFALFNENLKPGKGTERNWGLLLPNGNQVYKIDLTGQLSENEYSQQQPLSVATATSSPSSVATATSSPSSTTSTVARSWCVANTGVDTKALEVALQYACSQSPAYCEAIQPNKECYLPNTMVAHASYAFHSYWINSKSIGATCSFAGAALLTNINPSHGSCVYPGS